METIKKVTMTGKQFAHIMNLCSAAVSKDMSRPVLTKIHFDVVGDSVTAVALDGFVLTKVQIKCDEPASADFSFNMLPIKPDKKAEKVSLELKGAELIVTGNGGSVLTVPAPGEQYPAYDSILPSVRCEQGLVRVDAERITKLLSPYAKTGEANNCVELCLDITSGRVNKAAPLLAEQMTKLGKVQSMILPLRKI